MSMLDEDENERRKYYRIEDSIALDFALLTEDQLSSGEALKNDSALFNLLSDLHQVEFEAQHILRLITERDRNLANYLKVINKRIDLLGQVMTQNLLPNIGQAQTVSLSEGGINFRHSQAIEKGCVLALKIVLLPQPLGLMLRARVVHCQALDQGGYEIGTEFEELSDAQRQLLARHIFQKQALERRLAREPAPSTSKEI